MQYTPRINFDWLNASQAELNDHVAKLSRQRVNAVLRKHFILGNRALIARIKKALAIARAKDKATKTQVAAVKALEALTLLSTETSTGADANRSTSAEAMEGTCQ